LHLSSDGLSTHSIYVPHEDVRLPLKLYGCLSYIPTCLPSQEEIETLLWVTLTNELDWDPYSSTFAQKEELHRADLPTPEQEHQIYAIQTDTCNVSLVLASISTALTPSLFPAIPKKMICAAETSTHHSLIDKEMLAKHWGIGMQVAAQILQVTTQKGIHNALHPIQ
jgi:hypothetical protein